MPYHVLRMLKRKLNTQIQGIHFFQPSFSDYPPILPLRELSHPIQESLSTQLKQIVVITTPQDMGLLEKMVSELNDYPDVMTKEVWHLFTTDIGASLPPEVPTHLPLVGLVGSEEAFLALIEWRKTNLPESSLMLLVNMHYYSEAFIQGKPFYEEASSLRVRLVSTFDQNLVPAIRALIESTQDFPILFKP